MGHSARGRYCRAFLVCVHTVQTWYYKNRCCFCFRDPFFHPCWQKPALKRFLSFVEMRPNHKNQEVIYKSIVILDSFRSTHRPFRCVFQIEESYLQTITKVKSKWLFQLLKTTLTAFDSVDDVISVYANCYLGKPEDGPVYKTNYSKLFIFVKFTHTSTSLVVKGLDDILRDSDWSKCFLSLLLFFRATVNCVV